MKVAILTQGFLTGGGVPTIARWLKRELESSGKNVHIHDLASSWRDSRSRRVLSPRTWPSEPRVVRGLEDPSLFHWGANWVEFEGQRYRPRSALTDVLNGYDLIQVVAGGPALALAASKAQPPKVLQVATTVGLERRAQLHDLSLPRSIVKRAGFPWLQRLERSALRAVDQIMVENRWMYEWVSSQPCSPPIFAPPGIDIDTFRPFGPWNPQGPIVAFGRLNDARKDWGTAIDAFEQFIENTGLENQLVLAGRGPLSPDVLAKLAASPCRDRIDIRIDVPARELPSLLAGGSVFLQSSLEEGLGLAGLEAMACGLPVIATRTVGSSEYVQQGDNGFLIDIGADAGRRLAEGLDYVLSSGMGHTMSAAALETCRKNYSSAASFGRYEHVYQALVRDWTDTPAPGQVARVRILSPLEDPESELGDVR